MFDELSLRSIGWAAVLAVVLAAGYAFISLYRRSLRAPEPTSSGLLAELQAAYEAGELDEEEYRRVRESAARLAGGVEAPGRGDGRPIAPRPAPPVKAEAEAEPPGPAGPDAGA